MYVFYWKPRIRLNFQEEELHKEDNTTAELWKIYDRYKLQQQLLNSPAKWVFYLSIKGIHH